MLKYKNKFTVFRDTGPLEKERDQDYQFEADIFHIFVRGEKKLFGHVIRKGGWSKGFYLLKEGTYQIKTIITGSKEYEYIETDKLFLINNKMSSLYYHFIPKCMIMEFVRLPNYNYNSPIWININPKDLMLYEWGR